MPAPACRPRMPPMFPSPTRRALRFREIAVSFEPPVPEFECGFLYQVLRALAVMFRQRWAFSKFGRKPLAGRRAGRKVCPGNAIGLPTPPTIDGNLLARINPLA